MAPAEADSTPPSSPPRRRWWLNPYLHLTISIVAATAAQLLMKRGADDSIGGQAIFGFHGLGSGWVWLGIVAHITSLLSWLYALRFAPLSIAYNLTGAIQVIIPLAAWLFLGEQIDTQRWWGILLISAGVIVTANQAGKVEEKL